MQNRIQSDRGKFDPQNHPSRDEWMSYLRGEIPRAARSAFQSHLQICAACLQSVAELSRTMQKLDTSELPDAAGAT
ncbi:MAG: zf-HC2 domain-containing protein [Verrucomicrobiales bacterium]|nr:zf-HC2 domain-containing protein [Verrucomicrobiales bacterium]